MSTIYEESFTGLNGKGATNAGVDVSDCNWNINLNDSTLQVYIIIFKQIVIDLKQRIISVLFIGFSSFKYSGI